MEYNTTEDTNFSGIFPPLMDYPYGDYEDYGEDEEYVHPFHIPHIRGIFIFLYSVVFGCCFFGNLLVILVILRHQKMRTITNFFLANLAVADFFVGVFCVLPNLMINLRPNWVLGNFDHLLCHLRYRKMAMSNPPPSVMCKLYYFVQALSYTASISILTVISIERFVAIIHPMKSKSWTTLNRMRAVVVGVWIVAAGCGAPYLFFYTTVAIPLLDGILYYCLPIYEMNMPLFVTCNFLLFYILPLILMTVLYTKISIVLWRTSRQGSIEQDVTNKEKSRRGNPLLRKGIRMMVFKSRKRQERDKEYNSVPNIVVISAAPVASRENSPLGIRKLMGNQAPEDKHKGTAINRLDNCPNDDESDEGYVHDLDVLSDESSSSQTDHWGTNGKITQNDPRPIGKRQCCAKINNSRESCPERFGFSSNCSNNRSKPKEVSSNPKPVQTQVIRTTSKSEPKKREGALMARRKVIRLLMAVLISFSICVFPYHLRVMYQAFSEPEVSFMGMLMVPITFVIYYTNSGLNPILYAFLSDNFRKSLKEVITCSVKKPKPLYNMRNGGSLRTANTSV